MQYTAVVGGANVDIGGFPRVRLLKGDSNPGRVRLSIGGVGRNIAANAAALGLRVELVTALGEDAYARLVRESCARCGVSLRHAAVFPEEASSTYLYVTDADGEMVVAVNDMAIQERLTPQRLEPLLPVLNGAAAVVLDANLPRESLTYLSQRVTSPLIGDAVSAAKAERFREALPRLKAFKPNALETSVLTGIEVRDVPSAAEAARALLSTGLQRVFVTLGAEGAVCAEGDAWAHLHCYEGTALSTTGAGDAFTAALLWGMVRGLSTRQMAAAGLAAASIAVESVEAVHPQMCEEKLLQRMEQGD